MKVDSVSNLSFPIRPEENVFKKPDLSSDNYITTEPKQDEFIKQASLDDLVKMAREHDSSEEYDAIEQYNLERQQREKEFQALIRRPQRFQ